MSDSSIECWKCKEKLLFVEYLSGYVYVLSNPAMQGLLKIGMTEREVAERVVELSNSTGVAAPFEEEARFAVRNLAEAERTVHEELKDFRFSQNREFFKLPVSEAIKRISSLLGEPCFRNAIDHGNYKMALNLKR